MRRIRNNFELNAIIKLIFQNKSLEKQEIKKINLNKLIVISSKHQIIPLLFVKLKQKKILKYFEKDFVQYIRKIYNINRERNLALLAEIDFLSNLFEKYSIDHVFIKGTAMLINNMYSDIGERMIGDIDFLFDAKDIKKLNEVLLKSNYFPIEYEYYDYNHRHLPRLVNKNKLFAIEAHTKIINKPNKLISTKNIISERSKIKSKYIPSIDVILINNILNIQLNDFCNLSLNFSLKNIYDSILCDKKIINLNKIRGSIFSNYFYMLSKIKVETKNRFNKKVNLLFKIRFHLKYFNKFSFVFDKLIFYNILIFYHFLKRLPYYFNNFFKIKEFRKYVLNKIKL
tara:strand:+ start:112 stop:1137 length:1026 start_codon:yes stop_codon:yes gene_type:complete